MGKRKSRKPPPKKAKAVVPKSFDCPFCNHENSVEVKMEKSRSIGTIRCNICDANWQMIVTDLSEPVDVYSEWLDRCEEENQRANQQES